MLNYILVGYMWLFIHRPFEFWPKLGDLHVERVYMLFAILAWAVSGRVRWPCNTLHLAYLAFGASVALSWVVSPWSSFPFAQDTVSDYGKVLVFYFLLVTTIWTEHDLKVILLGFLFSMTLYIGHSLFEYRAGRHKYAMSTYRMIGVDIALGDPNSFSASILYSLPFLSPAWVILRTHRSLGFLVLAGYLCLALVSIILTGSRGSFLGLIVLSLLMALHSCYRLRAIVFLLALATPCWLAFPAELKDRFRTIVDKSAGPMSAQVSAEGRGEGFWLGLKLMQRHPAAGVGPGAWRPATGRSIDSHNLYGQVLGELGIPGTASFLVVLLLLRRNIRIVKRAYKEAAWPRDFLYALADATGISLVLLLFLGLASHNLFRHNWLWYGAFMIAARQCIELRQARAGTLLQQHKDPWEIGAAWISTPC
jgi:O-antigen ligase